LPIAGAISIEDASTVTKNRSSMDSPARALDGTPISSAICAAQVKFNGAILPVRQIAPSGRPLREGKDF
jgi:hypothetical protein